MTELADSRLAPQDHLAAELQVTLYRLIPRGGGGGVLGSIFAGYVPLASHSPYPIIVYSVANYRPHLSQLLGKYVIYAIPT